MKTNSVRFLSAALLMAVASPAFAAETVLSPAKRQEALERAKALVAPREVVPLAVDPFHPPAFAAAVAEVGRLPGSPTPGTTVETPKTGPRNDRDLLQAIGQSLKPSGYIVLGGQPSLSFGQKRVKPGGTLTITFEGSQYTLEILSIDRTNFTLRLNREEFTRTIK